MFGNKKSLTEELALSDSLLSDARKENTELHMEIKDLRETVSGFVAIKTEYENKLEKLNSLIASRDDVHKIELDSLNKSVNAKVASALASIGVSSFVDETILSCEVKYSAQDRLDEFTRLPRDKKTEYYNLYKDEIKLALSANK